MPHVTVKLHAGRSEPDKAKLAEAIGEAVKTTLNSSPDSISVAIEDVEPADWMTRVYEPDIAAKEATLYKRPGYGPLA